MATGQLIRIMLYYSGETDSAAGEPYSAHDITEGLNETNDSRGDTTMEGEVTQDSVAM